MNVHAEQAYKLYTVLAGRSLEDVAVVSSKGSMQDHSTRHDRQQLSEQAFCCSCKLG